MINAYRVKCSKCGFDGANREIEHGDGEYGDTISCPECGMLRGEYNDKEAKNVDIDMLLDPDNTFIGYMLGVLSYQIATKDAPDVDIFGQQVINGCMVRMKMTIKKEI